MQTLLVALALSTLILPSTPDEETRSSKPVARTVPARALTGEEERLLAEAGRAFAAGDYPKCLEMLAGVDGLSAAHPELLNLRGAVLSETGKVKEALPYFEWAAEADPGHFWARFNLAESALLLGEAGRARALFLLVPATTAGERELVALKLVLIDLKAGDVASAKRQLVNWPPSSAAGYAAYAAVAQATGQDAQRAAFLAEARSKFPGEFGLFLRKTLEESGIQPD